MSKKRKASHKTQVTTISTDYAESYEIIRPDGNMTAFSPTSFAMVFYTDELRPDKVLSKIPPDPSKMTVKRTIQCQLVFTPQQAKTMANTLSQQVIDYEQQFGEIAETPSEPERQQFIA